MEVSNLGNVSAAHKQTTEKNVEIKDTIVSNRSQGTSTAEAQTSPIPPINQINELSSEEGNTTNRKSESNQAVDLLA